MFILFLLIILNVFTIGGGLLLLGIQYLITKDKSDNTPKCINCGYDLRGTIGTSTNCPECGLALSEAGWVYNYLPGKYGFIRYAAFMLFSLAGLIDVGFVVMVLCILLGF